MEKILKLYDKVLNDVRLFAVFAFLFSLLQFGHWGFKLFTVALFAFIYALQSKKQASLKGILKFGIIFTILDFTVNFVKIILAFFSSTQVSSIRYCQVVLLLLLVFDVALAFIVYYLVNVISTKVIDKFSTNEKLKKIIDSAEAIFINSPCYFLALIILGIGCAKLYDFAVFAKGDFVRTEDNIITEDYFANFADKNVIIPFEKNKAIILKPTLNGKYEVFDSETRRVTKQGHLKGFKRYYRDIDIAWLNKNEILLLSEVLFSPKHKHKNKVISLGVLNTKDFSFKDLGDFTVEAGASLSTEQVGEDKVLIAGGKGYSKQAYIFDGKKMSKINNMNDGFINPIIIPYKKDEFIVAGKIWQDGYISSFAANVFNSKTKTFEAALVDEVNHKGYASLNLYNIFLDNNEIVFFYKDDRGGTVLHKFNADTFEKIAEIKSPYIPTSETVAWLKNGKLLVTGGVVTPLVLNSNAYYYDIAKGKTERLRDKPSVPRLNGKSILLNNGTVILYGGHVEDYNQPKPMELFIPWE